MDLTGPGRKRELGEPLRGAGFGSGREAIKAQEFGVLRFDLV